jgi:hypothetical protein
LSYGIEAVAKACWNNEQKAKKSGWGMHLRILISIKRRFGLAKVSPMLFLLRSIFWLLIVFASISWQSDPLVSGYGEGQGRARGARNSGLDDRQGASRGGKGVFALTCRLS